MNVLDIIQDIEQDIACLLDDVEDITQADLYIIQDKLVKLSNELPELIAR
jgi:hypothetical protein